ncbi:MAG: MATE family efflux transporter, partial [Clostridia bacterium]|nr:MATE family efflux transporter [Clostridia bacterium]
MKRSREEQREYKKNMMLTEPMPKVILTMAGPTIVAFLINAIYGLVDTYFVSGLGTNATAAISVNTSLDQFIMMVGSLLAVGANSYIARLLGANEKE